MGEHKQDSMSVWLADSLADWQKYYVADWLADWLTYWLIGRHNV